MEYSDEERVEQLKKWWQNNGTALIIGLVLAVGALLGWQAWRSNKAAEAEQASILYEGMMSALNQNNAEEAADLGKRIVSGYEGSSYAVLAAFTLAKLKVDAQDYGAARAHLSWASEHAEPSYLRAIARLRLARVVFADGDLDGALAALGKDVEPGLEAAYNEIKGDILRAKGDTEAARAAYQSALEKLATGARRRGVLQMKLDNVQVAAAALGEPSEPASPPPSKPAAETPAAAEPAAPETSAAETPAAETPAAETPATETPATETPAAETPAAETPAAETPAAETPATTPTTTPDGAAGGAP